MVGGWGVCMGLSRLGQVWVVVVAEVAPSELRLGVVVDSAPSELWLGLVVDVAPSEVG